MNIGKTVTIIEQSLNISKRFYFTKERNKAKKLESQ